MCDLRSSNVHHKQASYKSINPEFNTVFCCILSAFNSTNNEVQERTEFYPQTKQTLCHPFQPRSNSLNGSLWVFYQNRPRNITGITPLVPAITHSLQTNNSIYKLHTDCKEQERSLKWTVCVVVWLLCRVERRWTKQRDTHGGDIIRWRVFSLPTSQAGHRAAFGWAQWTEKQLFSHLFKVPLHMTHICMHRRILQHTHIELKLKLKN